MDHEHASSVDMGKVYDTFADAFAASDKLPTWRYAGKPAMERLLKPFLRPGTRFLDMGSASARVEAGVLIPGGVRPEDITGVEISGDQVEIAKKRIPGARFMVGDVSDSALLADEPASFDVIFSHMVFEHLSDEQLASAAKNAFRLLKPGGTFGFVVTHPGKMTDVKGDLVTQDGPFITTAPWGGELHNWRRSNDKTIAILRDAGFRIEATEDIAFPTAMPDGLSAMEQAEFADNAQKYGRYPAIRLLVKAVKPL
jgi:SAM-dependent methyltransferase